MKRSFYSRYTFYYKNILQHDEIYALLGYLLISDKETEYDVDEAGLCRHYKLSRLFNNWSIEK